MMKEYMSGLSVSEAEVTPLGRVDQPPTLSVHSHGSRTMDGVILSNFIWCSAEQKKI